MRKLDTVETELANATAELNLVVQQLDEEYGVTPEDAPALLAKLQRQVSKRERLLARKMDTFDAKHDPQSEDD
jgi:hypothetical protein